VQPTNTLKRLLRIRELEEEQSKIALEGALAELHRVEAALTAGMERAQNGRRLFGKGVQQGDEIDRLAGLAEIESAQRNAGWLEARRLGAELAVAEQREKFLGRQLQRRQVETLIEEADLQSEAHRSRREQVGLDDWHRMRKTKERDR
jgi:flagellar export protein FliJ